MATTEKWFTRSGFPMSETTVETEEHTVLGVGNPLRVGDIEITEVEYDALIAQNDLDAETALGNAGATEEVLRAQIRAKLVAGTPLTADEAARVI